LCLTRQRQEKEEEEETKKKIDSRETIVAEKFLGRELVKCFTVAPLNLRDEGEKKSFIITSLSLPPSLSLSLRAYV